MKRNFTLTVIGVAFSLMSSAQIKFAKDTVRLSFDKAELAVEGYVQVFNNSPKGSADTTFAIIREVESGCTMLSTVCDTFLCYGYDDNYISTEVKAGYSMIIKVAFEPQGVIGKCNQMIQIKSLSNPSNADTVYFRAEAKDNVGISKFTNNNTLRIYPNPAEGNLVNISTTDKRNIDKLEVFSILGTEISTFNFASSTLDVSNFPNGVYLVKVTSQNDIFTTKLVVKKQF